ncbi:hypothetical protein CRI94_06870 [Longibacter salinarum]|uniref:Peptidase S8/S53 domain-containing protein n=1 Tax=Longibacter salinarum TaxID=1850348 RepID=A0A2A8CYL7_9BACT|nr:S8 family serine peptidase [Longibacter salinarum]PEN13785.1 hypothetical protein CRI94_06870 [Longibacter salinarum]
MPIPSSYRQLASTLVVLLVFFVPELSHAQHDLGPAGSSLRSLYNAYQKYTSAGKSAASFGEGPALVSVHAGRVSVEIVTEVGKRSRVAARLHSLGMRGVQSNARLITGWLPVGKLPNAVAIDGVHSIYPALMVAQSGSVTSRGVEVMETEALSTALGTSGQGLVVGVLSDSYDNYDGSQPGQATASDDVSTGDLPGGGRVQILQDSSTPASDEGRAMMQIVHDVAPGADLAFHTATGGRAAFADAIRSLAASGSRVVVDDILYLNEPAYQDGIVTRAIDEVVRQDDVVYVSAAGNTGRDAFESPFRGSGTEGPLGGEMHDFDPGPDVDPIQQISISDDSQFQIAFQWSQPYASTGGPAAISDLEIYLVDKRGRLLPSVQPERRDNVGGDPFEFINVQDLSVDADGDGTDDTEFGLVIERISGPAPERIRYVPFQQRGEISVEEYATRSPSLYGHPNAESAITVGATAWFDTPEANGDLTAPLVHTFSAVGGTPVLFDALGQEIPPVVRQKPDVTGPDGTNTTFFGQPLNDGDDFPNFFGTSAAAPHVAALAAIIRSGRPDATAEVVKRAIIASAEDISSTRDDVETTIAGEDAQGFDFFSGTGLVRGDQVTVSAFPVRAFQARATERAPGGRVIVSWEEKEAAGIDTYRVEQSYVGQPFNEIASVPSSGGGAYEQAISDVRPGTHTFRLTWTTSSGDQIRGPETQVMVSVKGEAVVTKQPFPNPTRSSFRLELTASQSQNVVLAMYDVLGRYIRTVYTGRLRAGQPSLIQVNRVSQTASGQHFIRIIGETFETVVPVTVLR